MPYFNSETFSHFLRECPLKNWIILSVLLLISLFIYRRIFHYGSLSKKSLPILNINLVALTYSFQGYTPKYKSARESMCGVLELINGCCHLFEKERIFKVSFLMKPIVFLYKPETVEAIMKSSVNIDKMIHYKFLKLVFGNGLLTSDGKDYLHRRRLIEPFLHNQTLKDSISIFNKHSNVLLDKLQSSQCEWVDIVPELFLSTFDIICDKAVGSSINNINETPYEDVVKKLIEQFINITQRPWFFIDFIFYLSSRKKVVDALIKMLRDTTEKVIKERLIEAKENASMNLKNLTTEEPIERNKRKSEYFLDFLIKLHLEDPSFSENDIRNELDTFITSGNGTIALAIAYTLYLIGQFENRSIQILIHQELDEIFSDDIEREITWQDLTQMQYLECVIKESIRLYPSVPFYGREIKESLKIGDYTISKGSTCFVCPMMLHRDPESFPDPEKFIPERFFPENVAKRHPYAYIPFSSGVRKCLGYKFARMEGKAMLASILRKFTVISKDPRDKVNLTFSVQLMTLNPLMLKFIPR